MSAVHTPMVVSAARVLCRRMADACEFDHEDAWKDYGNDYLDDAKAALDAAGALELLTALLMVKDAAIEQRGLDFNLATEQWAVFHAAITKATGAA